MKPGTSPPWKGEPMPKQFNPAATMRPTAGATILPVPGAAVFSGVIIGAGGMPAAGEAAPSGGGVAGGPVTGLMVCNSPVFGWNQLVILLPWPSVNALQRIRVLQTSKHLILQRFYIFIIIIANNLRIF